MAARPEALTLPAALREPIDDGPASPLVLSLLAAALVHAALLLWLPALYPREQPRQIPESALEVLILPDRGEDGGRPPADAAPALGDRLGDSAQGQGSFTVSEGLESPGRGATEVSTLIGPVDTRTETDPLLTDPEPLPAQRPGAAVADALTPAELPPTPPAEPRATSSTTLQTEAPADEPIPSSPELVEPPLPSPPVVDASQILASRGQEIARLTASLEARTAAYASRVRRKSVSASTREFRYASYLAAWARKVERIGNINYPQEAKEQRLFGSLILHVSVRADGSVERIRVVRSSGHELLDEAAVDIVRLAAPFSPFPPDIAAETDVLDIVRTWQFLRGGALGWGQ